MKPLLIFLIALFCTTFVAFAQLPYEEFQDDNRDLGTGQPNYNGNVVIRKVPGTNNFVVAKNSSPILFRNFGESNTRCIDIGVNGIIDVVFPVNTTGYLITGKGLGAVPSSIFKTIDGGESWSPLEMDSAMFFYCISFINADTGYIAGKFLWDNRDVIRRTTDGGESWQTILLLNGTSDSYFACLEANDFVIVYDRNMDSFGDTHELKRSTDAGLTWSWLFSSYLNYGNVTHFFLFNNVIYSALASDFNNQYVVYNRSNDAGSTWMGRDTLYGQLKFYPQSIDTIYAWNIDVYNNNYTIIKKSTDGGSTWSAADEIFCGYSPSGLIDYGNGRIYAINDGSILYNSSNDSTWQIISTYGATGSTGHSGFNNGGINWMGDNSIFFNENEGIILSNPSGCTGRNIFYTKNGGKLWSQTKSIHVPITMGGSYQLLIEKANDMVYSNGAVYVVGGFKIKNGTGFSVANFMKSMDKGETWSPIYLPNNNVGMHALCFVDSNNVWISGDTATTYRTNDGGITWFQDYSLSNLVDNVLRIKFINSNLGFAWGTKEIDTHIYLLQTIDGGNSWSVLESKDYSYGLGNVWGVEFINDTVGYYVAINYAKTVDGGQTWTQINEPVKNINYRNDSLTYALKLYQDRNKYLVSRTRDNGQTWQPVVPDQLTLHNFPKFINDSLYFSGGVISFGLVSIQNGMLPPTAKISSIDSVYCSNENLHVTNNSWYYNDWRWYINGNDMGNSPTLNYAFPSPGIYQLKLWVSNLDGVDSLVRNITVRPATINLQSTTDSLCMGETALCNVITTGGGFTYQWQEQISSGVFTDLIDTFFVSGSNEDSMYITNTSYNQSSPWRHFRCIVNGCGSDTSETFTIREKAPTFVTGSVGDQTICIPNANIVQFQMAPAINATGYQWQIDNGTGTYADIQNSSLYTGVDNNFLSVHVYNDSLNGSKFRCLAIGECNTDGSNGAILNINHNTLPSSIVSQPINDTIVFPGDTAKFIVVTDPPNPGCTYKWFYRTNPNYSFQLIDSLAGLNYTNLNNDTLMIYPQSFNNNYQFRCEMSGCAGLPMTTGYAKLLLKNPIDSIPVWPGDVNNDGMVTTLDLLGIGLNFGYSGSPREFASNNWAPQYGELWYNSDHSQMLNHRADCDGSGLVNQDDTLAVYLNYGSTHSLKLQEPANIATNGDLYFSSYYTSYSQNQNVTISIHLGQTSSLISNANGVGFVISYSGDSSIVPGSLVFHINNSTWLGNYPATIRLAKLNEANHEMYGAISKIDHQNINGGGIIGYIKFTTSNTSGMINLNVEEVYEIDKYGTVTQLTSLPYQITVLSSVGINQVVSNSSIGVYPNPNTGTFTITNLKKDQTYSYQIKDMLGRTIYSETSKADSNMKSLKIDQAAGVYWLEISSEAGTETHKIIKE